MAWHERMNAAVEYIEEHLDGVIDMVEVARRARCSEYHFRRMFSFVAGVSVSEYIRRRRLTLAAQDLQQQDIPVAVVARRYGYSSPDAFARVFQAHHGFCPSRVRGISSLKAWPRMTFYLTIRGGEEMEYRIVEKPAFWLAGVSARVHMQFEGVNPAIAELARRITEEQRERMRELQDLEPFEIVNASYDADYGFKEEKGDLTHLIGVLTSRNPEDDLLDAVPVPASIWAVFPVEGEFPSAMQETTARVYAEWLPSSNYELVPAPLFSFTRMTNEERNIAYSEIWVAVKEAS